MARPKGAKNTLPSRHDQRELLRDLRERANHGDAMAAGQLVMIAQFQRFMHEVSRAAA